MAFAQSGIRSFRPPANSPAPFSSERAIRSVLNTKDMRTHYTQWSSSGCATQETARLAHPDRSPYRGRPSRVHVRSLGGLVTAGSRPAGRVVPCDGPEGPDRRGPRTTRNRGRCHSAHIGARISEATRGLNRCCRRGSAKPRHPISSPNAPRIAPRMINNRKPGNPEAGTPLYSPKSARRGRLRPLTQAPSTATARNAPFDSSRDLTARPPLHAAPSTTTPSLRNRSSSSGPDRNSIRGRKRNWLRTRVKAVFPAQAGADRVFV